MTENEMVGPHHQINGHEFEQLWELVMDREVGRPAVHGVTESDTTTEQLSTKLACCADGFTCQVLPPHDIPEVSAMIVLQMRKLRFVELSD